MSLFEFVTVMVSMILALCLGHLLQSASFLAKTERDVRHHLPYTLWSVLILLTVVNHWWSLWDMRAVDWNYVSFLYILVSPVLISFATGLLAPAQAGTGPIDLATHFDRVRRLFAGILTAYVLVMWFDGPLFAGQAVFGKIGVMHIPIIAANLMPALTASHRVHAVAAAVAIGMLFILMILRYISM